MQPSEDVLVRDEAPGISGGDALFDGLDKPPLVLKRNELDEIVTKFKSGLDDVLREGV